MLANSQITLIIVLAAILFIKAMVGRPALMLSWSMFWLGVSLLMQQISKKL
jgi:hypothetical protein